jgi:hypothetical protein
MHQYWFEKQYVLSNKKRHIRIINTFIAVHNEILERSFLVILR